MGYSFWLAASSHRLDNTYHNLCYTSRGALAGMRNGSMKDQSDNERTLLPWSYISFHSVTGVNDLLICINLIIFINGHISTWDLFLWWGISHSGCGIYYLVCRMVHIKNLLLVIRKSSPWSGGKCFFLLLSECSFTICWIQYNHK